MNKNATSAHRKRKGIPSGTRIRSFRDPRPQRGTRKNTLQFLGGFQ